MKLLLMAAAAALAVHSVAWHYTSDTDEMSGYVYRSAYIKSSNTVDFDEPYGGAQHATLLIIKTKDGYKLGFSIERGQLLCATTSDDCSVTIKIGDAAPMQVAALGMDDGSTTQIDLGSNVVAQYLPPGTPSANSMVPAIAAATTVKIQPTVFENGSPVFIFNTAGLDLTKLH